MAAERTVLVRLKANVGDFARGMAEAGAAVNALRKEINTTNDRTAWLTQGILAIAPAIVPLGAAAVPVFAGIAAQATVAGVAAGTVALAFNGIGDALKAVDTYKLDPTVENLTKMQQALDKVGPDGATFVKFLDDLEPALRQLQFDARGGMFPGLEDGITALLTRLPQVRDIVRQVAEGLGQLGSEAGHSLSGHEWDDFFNFLEHDAKPILLEMGHTVGNLASGLAALFVDLLPQAKGFTSGLEDASKAFDDWAHSLDGTEGFQKFLDYVDKSGPQAIAFLEALGNAMLALIEAGAPIGSHLLPVFTKLLDLVAQIASTPLGSTLLALGSIVSLYGRLAAIGGNLTTGAWSRGISEQVSAMKTGLPTYREFGTAVSTLSRNMLTAGAASERMAAQNRAASATLTGAAKTIGPTATQAALLGVILTGTDQKLHATNAASLALAGSLAGPWGIAVGGAVGTLMDLKGASDDAKASTEQLDASMSSSTASLSDYATAIDRASAAEASYAQRFGTTSGIIRSSITDAPGLLNQAARVFAGRDPIAEQSQALAAARAQQLNAQRALQGFGQQLGARTLSPDTAQGLQQLTDLASKAQPAMDALGISLHRLSTEPAIFRDVDVALLAEWTKHADSAKGRAAAMSTALSGLDTHLQTTAQNAQQLSQAMDDLFGPKMGVNAARNAWLESLRALNTQLDKSSKAILGTSNAALQNQDAVRGAANNMLAYLQAMAANGASSKQVTAAYKSQRAALIQTATQLGVSKKAAEEYIAQLGLTPHAINTLVNLNGADRAMGQISELESALLGIPRNIGVNINVTRHTNSNLADLQANTTPPTHRARGGWMNGPGGPTDDLIPALLSNGEFVVNAYAAARNAALLEQINGVHRYAGGGRVTPDGSGGRVRSYGPPPTLPELELAA